MNDWELIERVIHDSPSACNVLQRLRQQMEQQEGEIKSLKGLVEESEKLFLSARNGLRKWGRRIVPEVISTIGAFLPTLASVGTQGEQQAEVDAENPTPKSGSTMEGTDLAALVRRMNSATPEQIAQAMEQMPTDALEFGVKFESLSLPPQTIGRTPEWREKSGNLGGKSISMEPRVPQAQMHIREPEPIRCYLFLTNDLIRIDCQRPMPNVWVRFWLKALLGWRWEKV
jgi:hypothetical protein